MNNLLFDNVLPTWSNFNRYDNYLFEHGTPYTTSPNNKYRWDETDESYKLDILMPGMTKKDVDITFKEGTLNIKCKKDVSKKDTQFYGVKPDQSFSNFPRVINADKVTAVMENGVLSIDMLKTVSDKPKIIEIK